MKRDIRIDAFRGLFLVWMALNHLSGPLYAFTFQALGFVSSAEPFVFISGVTAGMVYGRIGLEGEKSQLRKRTFRRARDIYLFHLASFIFILILELLISNKGYHSFFEYMNPLPMEAPLTSLFLGAVFLLQPAILDILPMYSLFLLITPLAINGFRTKWGYWWVISASILIWSLATYNSWDNLQKFGAHFLPLNLGFFNPFAWQFLFVAGLFFGFRRAAGKVFPVRMALFWLSVFIAVGLILVRYNVIPFTLLGFDSPALTIRESFGPLRVINMAALAYIVTCLGIWFPRLFEWPFFSFLGQHSLQVFSFHVGLIYLSRPLYTLVIPYGWTAILLFNLLIMFTLAFPAWLHIQYRELRK